MTIVENRRGSRSAPTTVNSSVRTREYLTTAEIERLMAAARKSSRYGHRDATMILIGYRHGLRASELCDLQWSQVEPGHRPATRPQGEERLAECPPDAGRRDTRAATPAARTGAILARLYDRAGRADDAQGLPCAIRSDRGSGQDAILGTSTHAATWLRLCPGERGPRHTGATGVARPQEHSTHGALHRAVAASVQGLLALIVGDRGIDHDPPGGWGSK